MLKKFRFHHRGHYPKINHQTQVEPFAKGLSWFLRAQSRSDGRQKWDCPFCRIHL